MSQSEPLALDFSSNQRQADASSRAPAGVDYEEEEEASEDQNTSLVGNSGAQSLYNTHMRHGFGVISQEWMEFLAEDFQNYYEDKRHEAGGGSRLQQQVANDWRITDRQRTVNAALVLCLNLGVDPPDIIKTQPCAKLEAWVNPSQITDSKKAIEQIGKNLQAQYESLSTRTKYKQCLDPNIEDAKRFCMGLRRSARDERILFHYNGHGVPRPTPSGEIWVFNRGYTQYIPVSVYELQTWLGAPVIYCYDCSGAGNIVKNFNQFAEKRKRDERQQGQQDAAAANFDSCIQMGACRADEILPMSPKLPADMFTCCITTPVDIAIKWFVMQNSVLGLDASSITIPGKISDRRTPLGELNWIFTAITDTIAWSALDQALFKRLFRQDLVVAAMFRNFLLAVRIMRTYNCHPVSSPELPDTHSHPLWASWDLAVNQCLLQIPAMQQAEKDGVPFEYEHSDFFEQQLTAFEVWLKYRSLDVEHPPEQLPIILQVLLSQIHRLRALILLSRYLDLGPKAVKIALSIGFFIYVLKLLQSPAPELKPVLVFIWARIMAVDYKDVQHELVKENGYLYFVSILIGPPPLPLEDSSDISDSPANTSEHVAMCAFVVAQFCRGFPQAQKLCVHPDLYNALAKHMNESESPLLRQWSCLCFSQLWDNFPEAKVPVRQDPDRVVLTSIEKILSDPIPEVRAAALVALTTFMDSADEQIARKVIAVALDACIIVRAEVVVFISRFVQSALSNFLICAYTTMEEEYHTVKTGDLRSESPAHGSCFLAVWRVLLVLSVDPFPAIQQSAQYVVDYVYAKLAKTPLAPEAEYMSNVLTDSDNPNSPRLSLEAKQRVLSASSPTSVTSAEVSDNSGTKIIDGIQAGPKHLSGPRRTISASAVEHMNGNGSANQATPRGLLMNAAFRYAKSWWNAERESERLPTISEPTKRTEAHLAVKKPEACGTNMGIPHVPGTLVLHSHFYDWSAEYFTEPQLHDIELDEPGSDRYLERLWRKGRNERILAETQVQKDLAVTGSWNNPIMTFKNPTKPRKFLFAQYEPHMAIIDHQNIVSAWDWRSGRMLNQFDNSNPAGTELSDLRFINEDEQPLLLTAANDGMARVYRKYDSLGETELVTAWWLLADILPQHKLSPVCVEWHQSRGTLLVGGDFKVIRIWDAARESVIDDIPVGTLSRLTSLTTDQVTGNVYIAGFSDGSVNVYDRRLDRNSSLIQRGKNHTSSILNVRMQRGGTREVMSGSTDGKVNLWDIRMSDPVTSFRAHTREMCAVDIHEHAPVLATASRVVGLWSTTGRRVSTVRNVSPGYNSSAKPANISSLVFHPHRIMLAVNSSSDSNVTVFECVD